MASSTEICNLALGHLGVNKSISSLSTEQSQEANACRRFYDISLQRVLRDFDWPFARRYATLGLVEEDPNQEYAYSYRYPSDCVAIRKILSNLRNDTRQSRIHFSLGNDDAGQLVYTDQAEAEIRYTYLETDPDKFPPDFTIAFSYLIAYYIAPSLTGGDPYGVTNRALQSYLAEISRAGANAANEEQAEEDVLSEYTRARD